MKTILLSLMLFCSFAIVRAQNVVLNEIYGNPGGSNSEFIELYNSTGAGSMDCYTIMSYYENELGSTKGWYVLDLPNTCLLYTSDAADERSSVDLGGRRIIK